MHPAALDWATRMGQPAAHDAAYLALAANLQAEPWIANRRLAQTARAAGADRIHHIEEPGEGRANS